MALVVFAAFLALLPAWLHFDTISRDGAFQYVPMARQILDGELKDVVLNNPQLPLFPMLLAGASKLTGLDPGMSGRLISVASLLLAAMGLFQLTAFLFKKNSVAFIAVFFMLTNRQLVLRSVDCLKESLLIACIIWGNYLIVKGTAAAGRKWIPYAGGVSLLLFGAMFRSAALIFLFVWIGMYVFRKEEGRSLRAALFAAPFILVLAAWKLAPDALIFGKGSYHIAFLFSSTKGLDVVLQTLTDVVSSFFSVANAAVISFGLYGFYRMRKNTYSLHALITLAMFVLVVVFWRHQSKRYLLAPIIWMYPLCAYYVAEALRSARVPLKALGVGALIAGFSFWAHLSLTPPDEDMLARKASGEWILSSTGPGREIISNRDLLVFYAQGKYLPLSDFNGKILHGQVLAVDMLHEDGKAFGEKLSAAGMKPDRQFRTISVYLPRPTDVKVFEK